MKLFVAVIAAFAFSSIVGVARGDILTFGDYIGVDTVPGQGSRADPTTDLGTQPWLTVTITTNWSPATPTTSATLGTLTITAGSNWDSGTATNELTIFGLNVSVSPPLTSSNFRFNGIKINPAAVDLAGSFSFDFTGLTLTKGQSISYAITTTPVTGEFWNAASFASQTSGGSYPAYSEGIVSPELYIYANSFTYAAPEPSRLVGLLGMAIVGSLGMCFGFRRSRNSTQPGKPACH